LSERIDRVLGHPVFGVALAGLALLLFCWPFAALPRWPLELATLSLFCAWALVVTTLWLMSRHLGPGRGEDGGGDD
jgi:hypothetical protein